MLRMRVTVLLLLATAAAFSQWRPYACASIAKAYVVGAKLPPSGIFAQTPAGTWEHLGFNHPFISALDYDEQGILYLAGGNGLIRADEGGRNWKILTGWQVTELQDVAVDRRAPGTIYFAHTAGIQATRDGGVHWSEVSDGIRRKYTQAIRVDRTRAGHLVAGTETGLFFSGDGGRSWVRAGASGFQVMHIEQSPHDAALWLAVTQQGGLFRSLDGGQSFENLGRIGVDRNLYDVAFDPTAPGRIAVAGWGVGVTITEDGGKTWQPRNAGLPRADVWSVAFDPANDPAKPGRLYCGVHEEGLYVSGDAGGSWRREGLEGGIVRRLAFVPQEARR